LKYEQAEEMHRQALGLRETVLGKEHPYTLTSMNNLANLLSNQGKYEQAEEMHRQALRLKEAVLGKEHPSTLTSMNNLANFLSNQGKYEQAEEMHRQVLGLRETVLGKEHPSTLTSMNNLAGAQADVVFLCALLFACHGIFFSPSAGLALGVLDTTLAMCSAGGLKSSGMQLSSAQSCTLAIQKTDSY
jgi:prophage maintenance system killer protein